MSKEDKSISKLVEDANIDFKPTFDHFFVRLIQEDIDREKKRIEKESTEIQANEARKKDKVLVKNKNKEKEIGDFYSVISNHTNIEIHTVYDVGPTCEYIKVGDKVTIRQGARPELIKYGIYFYFLYSEKSISGIVKTNK